MASPIERDAARFTESARDRLPQKQGLDTPEGIKAALRKIAENRGEKAQDRIRALVELAELSGFSGKQKGSELERMTNEELFLLVHSVVLPALRPHGVLAKPVGRVICVRCQKAKIKCISRRLCRNCYQWVCSKRKFAEYPKVYEGKRRVVALNST
jgi:hypothetical protein